MKRHTKNNTTSKNIKDRGINKLNLLRGEGFLNKKLSIMILIFLPMIQGMKWMINITFHTKMKKVSYGSLI